MASRLRHLLFPEVYREIPHRRLVLNILRAIHILSFSILVGGLYFNQPEHFLLPWTVAVVISGLGMFALDLFVSCVALFEVRGLVVLVKILLLLCIPFTDGWLQLSILFSVVIFSALISHTSRKVRHFNILSLNLQKKYGFHQQRFHSRKNRIIEDQSN